MSSTPEIPDFTAPSLFVIPELDMGNLDERLAEMYQDCASNPNAFSNWFSHVVAENIKHPATLTVPLGQGFQTGMLNGEAPTDQSLAEVDDLLSKIEQFGKQYGFPLFIKTSYTSNKHYWTETCCLNNADRATVLNQIYGLIEYQACMSPHMFTPELVVREMIATDPVFFAFDNMPITEEYRVFARSGRIDGYQPYWPATSIENASVDDWVDALAAISTPSAKDLAYMTEASERITKRLGGYWSVDFLKDKDGQLWLIDMAEGDKSFKCEVGYKKIAPPQPDPEP